MKCSICGVTLSVKVLDWIINGQQTAAPTAAACYSCLRDATKEALGDDFKSLRPLTFEVTTETVDTETTEEVSSSNEMPNMPETEPDADGLSEDERRSSPADSSV